MGQESNVEGDEGFDSRQVRHPWRKGKRLDPGQIDDLQIPMFEACDDAGKFFVVKEVQIVDDLNKRRQLQFLLQELKMLCSLKHRNIVQYMGTDISMDDKTFSVFLKLMGQKSLLSIYNKDGNFGGLSEKQVRCYTLHILTGLKYLHDDKNMVHGDIRCANIWVDDDGVCKLTGFGRSEELITEVDPLNSAQTIQWTAPEVFDPVHRKRGFYSDIWSLGCTVIEMASGGRPYGELHEGAAFRKISEGEIPAIPETLPEDGKDFVRQCLQIDFDKRLKVADLLKHSFVKEARHALASEAQGSHSGMLVENHPQTHDQPYLSSRAYFLYEEVSYSFSSEYPKGKSAKRQRVAHGVTFTTKTGIDELQGSDMADPNKRFQVAEDMIRLIDEYSQRPNVDPDPPAKLVLRPRPRPESELPSGSSEIQYPEGRTDPEEAFEKVYNDISRKIESGASNLYILDGKWMAKLVYEYQVQIQNKFEDAGYFETINSDEFVCFENIASLSGRPQRFVSATQFTSKSNIALLSRSAVDQASSQGESSNPALPSSSHLGQIISQGGSSDSSGGNKDSPSKSHFWNWLGNIIREITSKVFHGGTNGNACGDHCRTIKLQVSNPGNSADTPSSSNPDNSADTPSSERRLLNFAQEYKPNEKWLTKLINRGKPIPIAAQVGLNCCMEEGNFCIKVSYLRGEVKKAKGTVVNCLRMSLAFGVQGEPRHPIQLTCMPVGEDTLLRVIDKGRAVEDVHGVQHLRDVAMHISPSVGVNLLTTTPSLNMGSRDVTEKQEGYIVRRRGEELELVSLERGSKNACEDLDIDMKTTLELKRDVANTLYSNKSAELTAVQMNDCNNPVKLIARVPNSFTTDSKQFKIICCVEMDISSVTELKGKSADEVIKEGKRRFKTVPFAKHFDICTVIG